MFITTFGQKGGVAKTCTSIHLAAHWAKSGRSVVLVDSDRNRSATAYASRGLLPFNVVPMEAAAKATRNAEIVVTDGQASSNEEELKNLVDGSDFIVLPKVFLVLYFCPATLLLFWSGYFWCHNNLMML